MLRPLFTLGFTACLLVTATKAMCETVVRTMPACVSEDILDELTTYSNKGDDDGAFQLIASRQCTMVRAGDAVSVISKGFTVTTIRYKGAKLYTPSEAIR